MVALTTCVMIAFAGNSLLCRLALKSTAIDPATFTLARLASGAVVLWLITSLRMREGSPRHGGNWPSAIALFVYAATLSFSYSAMTAATGALLLFGAVQITMIGRAMVGGENMGPWQWLGVVLAFVGLTILLLPGLATPPAAASALMICSGIAWGVYSIRGKGAVNPTLVTAGNFLRTVPFALVLSALTWSQFSADAAGLTFALASGAITSGLGYAIWYAVLPALKGTSAATIQLSVPAIAALGATMFLGESISARFVVATAATIGGIALTVLCKPTGRPAG